VTEAGVRERVVGRFRELHGRAPELLVRAPGRVSLLGGHVDYNEGWVLPGAIDRAVWLAAARGSHASIRASSLELGSADPVTLATIPGPAASTVRPSSGWIEYATGVAWALALEGRQATPIDAVIGSELPPGAGLSSSAALEVAFLVAWSELGGFALEPLAAAQLCRRVENEYLGVQSGLMDPFASLAGRRDHVLFLDCRTLEWERLAMPAGSMVLVADSGVRRRLVEGGLNDRRGECVAALRVLRERHPALTALRDVDRATLEDASYLPETLRRRVRHVVEECERVRHGASLLRAAAGASTAGGTARTAGAVGELMRASHASSRDLYDASIPELDVLAEAAWSADGCHGARLMGAGFGGCVAAWVEGERAHEVAAAMARAFARRFERIPAISRCRFENGAALA